MKDFWNNEFHPNKEKARLSKYQEWKKENNFRKANETEISCRTCKNLCYYDYHNKRYYKCEYLGFSHGPATDIRLSNLCDLWKEEEPRS